MKSARWRLRVKPSEIAFLKFILEGYDGIGMMHTLDPGFGMVCLHVPPGCEKDVLDLLKSLQSGINLEGDGETILYQYHRVPDECS
ncbi:MAG: DUF4911 domain-containing protein [Deltaproteobacteria bacterium]|nr:DUF4911 domain-containing protein [Deltaproteobacteria bacterium]